MGLKRVGSMTLLVAAIMGAVILAAYSALTPAAGADALTHKAQIVVDAENPPGVVELDFKSHGARLNGHLYTANGAGPHPTIILLHGYPGNEKNLDLAQALRRSGFNVLFFHYRGAWGSEGDFSFTHIIEDAASAIEMLRARASDYRVDVQRLILVGHSMGGFAALQAGARDETITCIAGIAPADLGVRAALFEENEEAASGFAAYTDDLQMLAGWSGQKALAEIAANRADFSVRGLASTLTGKSILLIAGDKDSVLPPDLYHHPMAAAFAAEDRIDLTEMVISGDHSFSWSRAMLIGAVSDWAETCR